MSMHWARILLWWTNQWIFGYLLLANLGQAVLMTRGLFEARDGLARTQVLRRQTLLGSSLLPKVSVLVPAFNEERMIVQMVTAILAVEYPRLEVVVVNDGSSDSTMQSLIENFHMHEIDHQNVMGLATSPTRGIWSSALYPQLLAVDKENGGKADALNTALNHATGEVVCAIDADTVIDSVALERLVRPMAMDPRVIAVGGVIRVVNGCQMRHGRVTQRLSPRKTLAGLQEVEYTRAFLYGRLGWNRLGGNIIISGAFGMFRRAAVLAIGGYQRNTVGEDIELILRLRRGAAERNEPHRVVFVPDPIAWTEVPDEFRPLARQRNRWHRGLLETLVEHRDLIGRPRYGGMGMFVLPYYIVMELLAPVVEALGLIAVVVALVLHAVDGWFALALWLAAYGFGLLLTVTALSLEDFYDEHHTLFRDRYYRIWCAIVEQFGYRQLTVVWRLWGIVSYLRGSSVWGAQSRKGFTPPAHPTRAHNAAGAR